MQPGAPRAATSAFLRLPLVLAVALLLALPLLFTAIPPLSDLPGHIGRAAVATYAPTDPALGRLLEFRWALVPNLGCDLIVQALQPLLGVTSAYWLVAAMIPVLFGGGIMALARTLNPAGGAAIAWALLFVWSYPYSFGFMNYMLGAACALIALWGWIRLQARPWLREALTWVGLPLLFLCHAAAGCLFGLLVVSFELAALWPHPGWLPRLLARCRPLVGAGIILVAWRLHAQSFTGFVKPPGVTEKLNAVVMLLRDQNIVLDIGSVASAVAMFAIGWRASARPHRGVAVALVVLLAGFVLMPPAVSGSYYADMRLLPLVPMLAFATQDWSRAPPVLARRVGQAGLALLLLRLGVTTLGFIAYDARYRIEAQALPLIPLHSRVLVLTSHECNAASQWRKSRLSHFGDLAIVDRRSWTNAEWDTDGAHLLHVLYRPSPLFYDDPSQYVWPARCGPMPAQDHRTLATALALAPYDGLDLVWIIDAPLPDGYANPRLRLRWQHGDSALFTVVPAATP